MCVFLLLAAVLTDEGPVLIELSIPALPVVHQAVITLVTAHRSIGRRPATLQWLVVLCVTVRGGEDWWNGYPENDLFWSLLIFLCSGQKP